MSETVNKPNKPSKTNPENYDLKHPNNWGAVVLISVFILGVCCLLGFIIYLFANDIKTGVSKELITGIGLGMGILPIGSKVWGKIMKSI